MLLVILYVDFASSICVTTSLTCCPEEVENAMNDAAFSSIRNRMPPYSLYLNESDRVFFAHYGQCINCITYNYVYAT